MLPPLCTPPPNIDNEKPLNLLSQGLCFYPRLCHRESEAPVRQGLSGLQGIVGSVNVLHVLLPSSFCPSPLCMAL